MAKEPRGSMEECIFIYDPPVAQTIEKTIYVSCQNYIEMLTVKVIFILNTVLEYTLLLV